jgi:outer membrane protein
VFIAKVINGLNPSWSAARFSPRRVGRARFFRGFSAWLCFTVPAVYPVLGQAQQRTAPPETAATAAPVAPATVEAPSDVAPRFASVLAQPGGLTSNEAARRGAETSVQAAIEREDVRQAEDTKATILWRSTPQLTLTARATRLSEIDPVTFPGDDGTAVSVSQPSTNYYLNAGLTIPLSNYLLRFVQALRGATSNRDAAELEERAARTTSASNARLAYYDWVRTRLETVVAEQALGEASAQLVRMRALFSVGRAAQADLLQAQAFEADAQLSLSQSRTRGSVAEERLRLSIHAPPGEALSVGEDVLADFAAKEEARGLDELYREALAGRLEIRALERSHAALADSRHVEYVAGLPRLEATGNYTYANPNQRIFPSEDAWNTSWDVGLQLTWTINDFGVGSRAASTISSQMTQLDQRRIGVEEQLRIEVVSALGALNEARQNITTAEQGERAATAAYEARARLQEQGMGTALELMQAETLRIRARLNLIYAHIALRVARTQLDHAVGRDIPNEMRAERATPD